MSKGKLSALIIAGALVAVNADAAEIVTKCPRINDGGRAIRAMALLPTSAIPIDVRYIRPDESAFVPNVISPRAPQLLETYWRPGSTPITEASIRCAYEDNSILDILIPGVLLRCTALETIPMRGGGQLPLSCTSQTDPGLLLGK